MHNFRYEPETHTYWDGDKRIPGVTEILTAAGLINTEWFTEEHALRGTAVHAACLYYLQGDLDEESLDPRIYGYLEGFKSFMNVSGFQPEIEIVEIPLYEATICFGGTPDLPGRLNGRDVILDIKTGGVYPYHGLQLAAYKRLLLANGFHPLKRFVLQLTNEGTYKLHEFKDRKDEAVFQAALTLYQWKQLNGGK